MTVEAESTTTDEVVMEGGVHSAEVCVEIHTQKEAERLDEFANKEMIENKPEGNANFEGKTDNESQIEVIEEQEKVEDKEKTEDSFEIVVSTDGMESSLGNEAVIKGSFEVIDIVIGSGDDVKPGDIDDQEEIGIAENEAKSEEKGSPFEESEGGNESNSFDDAKNIGFTADEVKDVQQPVTENETVSDVIESIGAESSDITREGEENSAYETTDDVKFATDPVPEVDAEPGDQGKEVEVTLLEEGLPELNGPGELLLVSEDPKEEGQKENPEVWFSQEVVTEETQTLVVRNETIVTIETTAEDEGDFIILENDPHIKDTSSTEQIEIPAVDVTITTGNKIETSEELA